MIFDKSGRAKDRGFGEAKTKKTGDARLLIFSWPSVLPEGLRRKGRRKRVALKPCAGDNQDRAGTEPSQKVPFGASPSSAQGPQGIPGPRRFPAGDMN